MTHHPGITFDSFNAEHHEEIHHHWYWWTIAGGVLVLIGAASVVFPFAASIGANYALASILLLAGIIEMIHAFRVRSRWHCSGLALFNSLVALAAGILLALNPVAGLVTLTVIITAFLLVNGIIKVFYAFRFRHTSDWPWLAATGGLAILLVIAILSQFPEASVWLLGTLVGFDLVFTGVWLISLGMKARRA